MIFARRREWLGELCRIAARLLADAYEEALPGARPGLILFVQTFGDWVNFNPHLHVLAADGAFLADGRFAALPRVPGNLLAEGFRRAVLDFLVKNEALSDELRKRMLAWGHSGFSAHNEVRVAPEDAEGRKQLAGYMLRAPKKASPQAGAALPAPSEEPATEFSARARAAWARLIRKVYEADPLECPNCNGPMRVIALESRIRESSGASWSIWDCGCHSPPSEVRRSVPQTGPGTPTCR